MTTVGPGRDDDVPRVRLHRAAIAAAGGVVLVALAVAILGHVAQWSRRREALERMRPGWLPAVIAGALVLALATGYVATALPLPVGGAGGVDASLALTLTAVGAPLAAAVLAAVLYRGVAFWLPIAPAAALLPTVPAPARELDAVAAVRGGAR